MKILAILAIAMPATAIAQAPAAAPARSSNERVCRTAADIGSRLARTRRCLSRAEWDTLRRENRDGVDRVQRQFNPRLNAPPGTPGG